MSYTAQVHRSGKYWAIYVPEVDRHTQARRYSEVEEMARDLIDAMGGDASAALSIKVELPAGVRRELDHAAQLEQRAKESASAAAAARRHAVRDLVDSGMSQREAADVLGLSFQRVNQLVNS